jgi:hypothetical protein
MGKAALRVTVKAYYPENDITSCINTLLDIFAKYRITIEVERE